MGRSLSFLAVYDSTWPPYGPVSDGPGCDKIFDDDVESYCNDLRATFIISSNELSKMQTDDDKVQNQHPQQMEPFAR